MDVQFQLERGILKCPGMILGHEGLGREVRLLNMLKLPLIMICSMTELFGGGNGGRRDLLDNP